jgi:hypothetical protein
VEPWLHLMLESAMDESTERAQEIVRHPEAQPPDRAPVKGEKFY